MTKEKFENEMKKIEKIFKETFPEIMLKFLWKNFSAIENDEWGKICNAVILDAWKLPIPAHFFQAVKSRSKTIWDI